MPHSPVCIASKRHRVSGSDVGILAMIAIAPVLGPVMIVLCTRQLLRGSQRNPPAHAAPGLRGWGQAHGSLLALTATLTTIFTATSWCWLAFQLPPAGPARIPVALLAGSLTSSLAFFPSLLVLAVYELWAPHGRDPSSPFPHRPRGDGLDLRHIAADVRLGKEIRATPALDGDADDDGLGVDPSPPAERWWSAAGVERDHGLNSTSGSPTTSVQRS